ncbi:MAG: hypothetical protein JWN01_979 [Patescibacteria group bacterium]|nr:hypothetical protein [Patescibacteria group bacterium]
MASVSRGLAIFGGILTLAVLAGGLTEATLAIGHRGGIMDDTLSRPVGHATPAPTPKPAPSATPASAAPATPVPTLGPSSDGPTAITNSFVHMRAGKSTATAILADLDGDTRVRLLPDSDAQWQQVEYNGLVGYIFKTYLNR